MGEQITYTHRGESQSVWVLPTRNTDATMRDWSVTRSRELPRTFKVPMQPLESPTFPPSDGPIPGDTFIDENGDTYMVRNFQSDDNEAVYTFQNCVNTKTKTVGPVGGA